MAAIKIPPNKYRDAIDQVIAYNSKILLERRLRYPYIDGQTGVAQQDCHLWVSRVARSAPNREGQVCSYPARRWRVRKRPDFDKLNRTKVKQETASKTRFSSSTNNEMFEPGKSSTKCLNCCLDIISEVIQKSIKLSDSQPLRLFPHQSRSDISLYIY